MTYEAILKDLKDGKVKPVYFLHGEEPYYIDQLAGFIEHNILSPGEQAFNQVVLYGKDVDFKNIADEARQFPMMSSRRVIVLKEGQEMKTLFDLINYIENPSPTTLLVICYKYKKIDKRTKFWKLLEDKAIVFESKKLYDNQIPIWIKDYLKSRGFQAESGTAEMLSEYLGADLSKISNELDKLMLNVPTTRPINMSDVREQIGISKDFDVFELTKMLGERNFAKAALIMNYFADNPGANPVNVVLGSIYSYINKVFITQSNITASDQELSKKIGINSFFIKEYRVAAKNYSKEHIMKIFLALKSADKASKGIGFRRPDDGAVLKDLLITFLQK